MKDKATQVKIFSSSQRIRQVSQGREHTLFLTCSGSLYSLGRNQEGQRGLGHQRQVNDLTPMLIPKIDNKPIRTILKISTSNFMSAAVAQLQGDQEVVLFCGTRYSTINKALEDAPDHKLSFSGNSVRLNLATVETGCKECDLTQSFSSSMTENMSLTEADQDWFDTDLQPPDNKLAITQSYLEGTIYLDEEFIKVSQICLIHSSQNFLFTLDYLPSPNPTSNDSSNARRLTSAVSNSSFDNNTDESDESADDCKTWLRNELEAAQAWNPEPQSLAKEDFQEPKLLQVKREGTIATLVTLPSVERERRKGKKPIVRKRGQTGAPTKSNGTPQRSKGVVSAKPKSKTITSQKQLNEMSELFNSMRVCA